MDAGNKSKKAENENPTEPNDPKEASPLMSALTGAVVAITTSSSTADTRGGAEVWFVFNAVATIIVITILFFIVWYGISMANNIRDVKANWDKYRCDPSIMPFASFYGFNTAENFNYCMGTIFDTQSVGITAPFASIMSKFTGILGVLMNATNGMRTSIATLGGGINVIFQEFVDRISSFFFQMRQSAIRMKMLMARMYTTMFAVIYMGTSSIAGVQSFSNTVLFSFLDTFCFEPSTQIRVKRGANAPQRIAIADVRLGDILLPTGSRVTSKFHFNAYGQPMVRLQSPTGYEVYVSSNHYMLHDGRWIRSEHHPDATAPEPYPAHSLVCLNTSDNVIPIGPYIFRDYDESADNDIERKTMRMIESRINALNTPAHAKKYVFKEYFPSVAPSTEIRLANGSLHTASSVALGTRLSMGGIVIGKVHRFVREYCIIDGEQIASSTLVWQARQRKWIRVGEIQGIRVHEYKTPQVYIALFVTPSSVFELKNGMQVRDSIELCSPDAEMYYAEQLTSQGILCT